jgi:hypothetical protein
MNMLLAIDPGPEYSALVVWDGVSIIQKLYAPNRKILRELRPWRGETTCVIERVASYGMPVGEEVFETVYWSGRFAQAFGAGRVSRIPRLQVKLHLCHDSRAKDANIRQALVDRFGGKDKAIGKKASPGPLYGIGGDLWSALAIAVMWWDTKTTNGLGISPA